VDNHGFSTGQLDNTPFPSWRKLLSPSCLWIYIWLCFHWEWINGLFFFLITAWHGFQWYYVVYKSIPIPLQLPSGRLVLFLFFVSIRINVIILSLFKIIYLYSVISCATITFFSICTIHHDWLKNLMKIIYFWYLILKWGNYLVQEVT
jgi:hypothetical protein